MRTKSAGLMPSRVRNRCTPAEGELRGDPESITTTDRRARPTVAAAVNPAAPPPITATSKCWVRWTSGVGGMGTTVPLRPPKAQSLLPVWQTFPMADDLDTVLAAVGPRLRALRQQHETTLAELSATTGISVSTLSRLESGQRRPNL